MPFLPRPSDVTIYYTTHGTGPPLLLTHGFSSTSSMWSAQIPTLSQTHTLILWDMRGHGQSSYPSDPTLYSEAHTIADMAALLDHICGGGGGGGGGGGADTPAIIGGLSLGGYMSLAFHRTFPQRVRALLIIDTGPGFKQGAARDKWNAYARETGDRFDRDGLGPLAEMSPERRLVSHRDATGLALAARGMLAQRDASVIDSLPGIRVPALVVVGADDRPFLAASEYMAKKIPGARKAVVPNAGHAVNIDQPEAFIEAVLPFLREVDTATRKSRL